MDSQVVYKQCVAAVHDFRNSVGAIEKPLMLEAKVATALLGTLDFMVQFESAAGVLFNHESAAKRFSQDLRFLMKYRQVGGDFRAIAERISNFRFLDVAAFEISPREVARLKVPDELPGHLNCLDAAYGEHAGML